ncbi:hypothetical protein [Acinetobacter colistiniresistens]|uniref:hypothetical protein n=1 Tax=Acinetobacter colistiniresistens TaxID=280145 RepID=UPI001250CDFB|nr:hypothetical protein [Acinetobacter colistiniresistens]
MTRRVQTPGATAAQLEETKAADSQTQLQTDAALQHINNGNGDDPQEQQVLGQIDSHSETILTNQELILEGQKRIENKLDQLLAAGGIEVAKKMRWVQGKNGHELKEV